MVFSVKTANFMFLMCHEAVWNFLDGILKAAFVDNQRAIDSHRNLGLLAADLGSKHNFLKDRAFFSLCKLLKFNRYGKETI